MINYISGFCSGACFCFMLSVLVFQPVAKKTITQESYFQLDGKEWQCGLTPRQVEINLLEDKIAKIKQ